MRAIIALSILLLGANSAAPEVEFASLIGVPAQASAGDATAAPIEIESATRRGDRLAVAALQGSEAPPQQSSEMTGEENSDGVGTAGDIDVPPLSPTPVETETISPPADSVGELCNALFTSAQNNDLPVPFFANLIWQESRLHKDSVSPKGALGIAQFMPQTAAESGLQDPFDPYQAIPASARLLHALRAQLGNLGFAAAAYNAGAARVMAWLEHRQTLPRETRDYVVRITGRSAEDWRKTPPEGAAMAFAHHLPCRSLPAFASVEEAQKQQEDTAPEPGKPGQETASATAAAKPLEASASQDIDRERHHSSRPYVWVSPFKSVAEVRHVSFRHAARSAVRLVYRSSCDPRVSRCARSRS
jgi:soluble lytic murein transglycosylase-like protein